MNKLKFLILPLILGLGLLSCGDSNSEGELNPDDSPVKTYLQLVDVTLEANYQVTDSNTDDIIIDVKHTVASATTLIYAIHRKHDGELVSLTSVPGEKLKGEVKNGVFSFGANLLPGGEYYVSAVAVVAEEDAHDYDILAKQMTKNYKDAVVQIGNAYTYYNTMELTVKADNKVQQVPTMRLKKMTTDMVFSFIDANKLPKDKDKYTLTVGVKNIPAAFYLATGITLTDKEVKEQGVGRYTGSRTFALPGDTKKALVTQFHALRNNDLTANEAERGSYWYEFVEKRIDAKPLVKSVSNVMPECKPFSSFYLHFYQLIMPEKEPRVVVGTAE